MRCFLLILLLVGGIQTGCVVSTHGSPSTEPTIPAPPQLEHAEPVAAETAGPAQIAARHILISHVEADRAAPYVERSKDEARAFCEQLRDKALEGADFAELAKENSDDRGSAVAGGELGTFRREQMVKEFSDAAFALEVGGISEVVESSFGFHLIQRTE